MTYDLFDLILKSWDRPMREASGYKIVPTEAGYQIILNTLGIKPGDIEVKVDKTALTIRGKTENEAIHFTNSVNYQFSIENIQAKLKEVSYEVADGLTIVELLLNKEVEKLIEVKRK